MRLARWTWPLVALLVAIGLVVFLGGDTWEPADQKSSVVGMLFGGADWLHKLSTSIIRVSGVCRVVGWTNPVSC
jgi:hypothetical protein